MTRLGIVATLVLALSSFASADRAYTPARPAPVNANAGFAQPPVDMVAPDRVLDRAAIRAALAKARATNLAAFRAYQQHGVFPSNTYTDGALNVWRDANGHLCAAATIINASGEHALVQRVADQTNFIRLADVTSGPLMDWILTSGLTQDEIVQIQKPFMPVTKRPVVQPTIDPTMRASEDARLKAKYIEVTRSIVTNEKQSLDAATDRLMKHPELAWKLLGA